MRAHVSLYPCYWVLSRFVTGLMINTLYLSTAYIWCTLDISRSGYFKQPIKDAHISPVRAKHVASFCAFKAQSLKTDTQPLFSGRLPSFFSYTTWEENDDGHTEQKGVVYRYRSTVFQSLAVLPVTVVLYVVGVVLNRDISDASLSGPLWPVIVRAHWTPAVRK